MRDELESFVSHPKSLLNWPDLEIDKCNPNYVFVRSDGPILSNFSIEFGRKEMCDDESLYDESEHVPYYQLEFLGAPHYNFGGVNETHGPVVISMKPAKQMLVRDPGSGTIVRGAVYVIIRTVVGDERTLVPFKDSIGTGSVRKSLLKCFKKYCTKYDDLTVNKLDGEQLEKGIVDFERHYISRTYKFGVLYALAEQSENEMFSNKSASPRLEQFLDFMADKVTLEGFEKFRGGLDVKSNSTGTHTYYTQFRESEIIFHVSTLLPFDQANEQQLERKRHIGNDVVLIVFLDSDDVQWRFDPEAMCSQVNQVFFVVRPLLSPAGKMIDIAVNIVHKKGVPPYQPFLSDPPVVTLDEAGRYFFLTKLINAERAAMCAPVYRNKLRRSRRQMLQNLVESFTCS